ncbi:MAG TPA: SipW-dependent-type signal peptide-containing protein [Nocardioides sp.]|nr:SipW-dependent-type signal peptide-containing protein [Nocardioides sp.]
MRSARTHLTKIAATVALVAGAAGVAGVGTFGAYTDTTKAEAVVSSGKVSVLINGSDTGVQVATPQMVTSDSAMFPITIERATGSAELGTLSLATAVTGDAGLAAALRMTIAICPVAWNADLTCSGASSNVVVNAPLSMTTAIPVADLNLGKKFFARATITLPADAPAATAGKTATVTWTLSAQQRTGRTTVVTPAPLP